jgi:hypothetical protein
MGRTKISRRALEIKYKGKIWDDPEKLVQPDTGRQ